MNTLKDIKIILKNKLFGNKSKVSSRHISNSKFVLFEYLDEAGKFDYEKYRAIQIEGNHRKLSNVWVIRENIDFLSNYLKENIGTIDTGICHGTRRGCEQTWFREGLKCDVFGTEISDTATQFPNTIQWDFHEIKPEWIGRFDFIYSNSLDHSYNPESCIKQWMKCLNEKGLCIIEHTSLHSPDGASQLDPFGATIEYMPYLISQWGRKNFGIYEILQAPARGDSVSYNYFIILKNFV